MFQIFNKVLFNINDPLPCLLGNEQDLCHENIDLVNTYLFYQMCKVHDTVCLGEQSANIKKDSHLSFRHFCLKLVSWMVTVSLPNFC